MGLVLAAAFGIAAPVCAHHSHAMYESDRRVTLDGTVKDWQWANPHVFLYIVVQNAAGEAEEWVLEAGGVNGMTTRGWSKDSFKPGDRIKVQFRPLKDGSTGGVMGTVFFPDGRSLNHPD
jgi:hypothetical protein